MVKFLREGQQLQEIRDASRHNTLYAVGESGVTAIYISMEHGQMSMVPWAHVIIDHGERETRHVNLAHVGQVIERHDPPKPLPPLPKTGA